MKGPSFAALVFAFGAFALSAITFFRKPAAARENGPLHAARITAPPRTEDTDGECEDKARAESLQGLMRQSVNRTLSNLSLALHHDASADRMTRVSSHAGKLLRCIRYAATLRPDIPLEGLSDYYRFLSDMQDDALALNIAAAEGDERAAIHWFTHLKEDCIACHSRFRIEAPGAIDAPK